MKQEIFINSTPQESRIAVIEDGQLAEFLIERKEEMGIAGNIYKGKVARVLPGMQAAFVDIGMENAGFRWKSGSPGERRFWSKWRRTRWGRRERGSPLMCRCRAATWFSCRVPIISEFLDASRATRSANGSKRSPKDWVRKKAGLSCAPPVKG